MADEALKASLTADEVRAQAEELRDYATHFAARDWDYTRDLGDLAAIRYDRADETRTARVRRAFGWLVRRPREWERQFGVSRWRMARHSLRRPRHLPDGILYGGGVIAFWEETGEYLQKVQPSVGALVADMLEAHPDSPEAQALAAELKRIADRYAKRLEDGQGERAA